MPLIIWRDSFLTGFSEIDQQHKKLVDMINTLFDSISNKDRQAVLDEAFISLVKYTQVHFKQEEELMVKYAYANFIEHSKEHADFIAKVTELSAKFKKGDNKVLIDVINFLKDWLINHIIGSDKKYIPTFQKNGLQ
jgi:hemerythrin